jgi:hypothetical protein
MHRSRRGKSIVNALFEAILMGHVAFMLIEEAAETDRLLAETTGTCGRLALPRAITMSAWVAAGAVVHAGRVNFERRNVFLSVGNDFVLVHDSISFSIQE